MDDFRSLSFVEYAKFVGVGREKESLSNAITKTTTTRTPPSIGFASSENLFSYVRLPVSKSVESITHFVVSVMCRDENKRERSNPIDLRARLYYARKRTKRVRTFRAFRDVWVVLRHGGGAFFFLCVFFRFSVCE